MMSLEAISEALTHSDQSITKIYINTKNTVKRKRPITGYLSNYSLLQYTVIKKLEDFFMSQPIVPLTVPKSRRFEKKSRNEILMKIRLEKVELTFFHSINQEVLETILDKVLFYDNPAQ